MDWANNFYSTTGTWWGGAESKITDNDHRRAALIQKICPGPQVKTILELGAGYGSTAAATAMAGYDVVANELSDRIEFSKQFTTQELKGSLRFIKGDFYTADLGQGYDVVTYWNGFGVGSDADQRRLLKRIAREWLKPTSKALIDIGNPFVRASWAGDEEHPDANPELGYPYNVEERTDYDPVQNRFIDTWWRRDKDDQKFTQTIRNYTPADLLLLLEGTGLKLEAIYVNGEAIDPYSYHIGMTSMLKKAQEYLAVLVRVQ